MIDLKADLCDSLTCTWLSLYLFCDAPLSKLTDADSLRTTSLAHKVFSAPSWFHLTENKNGWLKDRDSNPVPRIRRPEAEAAKRHARPEMGVPHAGESPHGAREVVQRDSLARGAITGDDDGRPRPAGPWPGHVQRWHQGAKDGCATGWSGYVGGCERDSLVVWGQVITVWGGNKL